MGNSLTELSGESYGSTRTKVCTREQVTVSFKSTVGFSPKREKGLWRPHYGLYTKGARSRKRTAKRSQSAKCKGNSLEVSDDEAVTTVVSKKGSKDTGHKK